MRIKCVKRIYNHCEKHPKVVEMSFNMFKPIPRGTDLILASSSPYRAALLKRLKIPFDIYAPFVDESEIDSEPADLRAMRLASEKADVITKPDTLSIGSDQVATCNDQILHKPKTQLAAKSQLTACSGERLAFWTAICVKYVNSGERKQHLVFSEVKLRDLTDEEIDAYLRLDDPLDCAGSFKWESLGITLIESINTKDPTALEGLPLIALSNILRSFGVSLPGSAYFVED